MMSLPPRRNPPRRARPSLSSSPITSTPESLRNRRQSGYSPLPPPGNIVQDRETETDDAYISPPVTRVPATLALHSTHPPYSLKNTDFIEVLTNVQIFRYEIMSEFHYSHHNILIYAVM